MDVLDAFAAGAVGLIQSEIMGKGNSMRGLRMVALLTAILAAAVAAGFQHKGGEEETGPYEVVPGWPRPLHQDRWTWGSTAGVWAESPNRVFVFQRGELPVLDNPMGSGGVPARAATGGKARWQHCLMIFDADGKLVESWQQHNHLFVRPHRVVINPHDPERHVWLVVAAAKGLLKN